jgi:hypothetical protein
MNQITDSLEQPSAKETPIEEPKEVDVPEKYKGKFPKGTTVIQESIAYSDYALKKFF